MNYFVALTKASKLPPAPISPVKASGGAQHLLASPSQPTAIAAIAVLHQSSPGWVANAPEPDLWQGLQASGTK